MKAKDENAEMEAVQINDKRADLEPDPDAEAKNYLQTLNQPEEGAKKKQKLGGEAPEEAEPAGKEISSGSN